MGVVKEVVEEEMKEMMVKEIGLYLADMALALQKSSVLMVRLRSLEYQSRVQRLGSYSGSCSEGRAAALALGPTARGATAATEEATSAEGATTAATDGGT